MKILLEAFVDNNFGDNLFVQIVASQYPENTFYMVEKEAYAESYRMIQEHISNVTVLEKGDSRLDETEAMYIVGGDLFWDRADYSNLIRQAVEVKKRGGVVAIFGFSLFPKYVWYTWFDLAVLFSQADFILVRDNISYSQLKKKLPWMKVVSGADLAFSTDVTSVMEEPVQEHILGVSVRKKIQKDAEYHYLQYCKGVAKAVEQYLRENPNHEVRFLALSSGQFDDSAAAKDIMKLCSEKSQERMSCVSFEGDVQQYISEIQKCGKLICTRFHALVFALLLKKPFLPIVYEEKVKRLLKQIQYEGVSFTYEEVTDLSKRLEAFSNSSYNEALLEVYRRKSKQTFLMMNQSLRHRKGTNYLLYAIYVVKEFLLNGVYRKLHSKNQ